MIAPLLVLPTVTHKVEGLFGVLLPPSLTTLRVFMNAFPGACGCSAACLVLWGLRGERNREGGRRHWAVGGCLGSPVENRASFSMGPLLAASRRKPSALEAVVLSRNVAGKGNPALCHAGAVCAAAVAAEWGGCVGHMVTRGSPDWQLRPVETKCVLVTNDTRTVPHTCPQATCSVGGSWHSRPALGMVCLRPGGARKEPALDCVCPWASEGL